MVEGDVIGGRGGGSFGGFTVNRIFIVNRFGARVSKRYFTMLLMSRPIWNKS